MKQKPKLSVERMGLGPHARKGMAGHQINHMMTEKGSTMTMKGGKMVVVKSNNNPIPAAKKAAYGKKSTKIGQSRV